MRRGNPRGTSPKTRALSSLLVLALCSVGVSACGGAGKGASADSHAASNAAATATTVRTVVSDPALHHHQVKSDNDGDGDNSDDDIRWGNAASAAERQAVITLVRRYYALAAASNGAAGCSLIYSLLAEEIPELYGEPPGPPSLRGGTCAVVMSELFKHKHRQLVADSATLEVIGVRVKRLRGLALLHFAGSPERDIPVHREHRAWRIDALLDSGLG